MLTVDFHQGVEFKRAQTSFAQNLDDLDYEGALEVARATWTGLGPDRVVAFECK